MRNLSLTLLLLPLAISPTACDDEPVSDVAQVCIVDASADRFVFEARVNCAGENRGAELSCGVEATSANTLRVATSFRYGKDRNDGCSDLVRTCESPELSPGTYTIEYAGEAVDVELPSEAPPCFGDAWHQED